MKCTNNYSIEMIRTILFAPIMILMFLIVMVYYFLNRYSTLFKSPKKGENKCLCHSGLEYDEDVLLGKGQ